MQNRPFVGRRTRDLGTLISVVSNHKRRAVFSDESKPGTSVRHVTGRYLEIRFAVCLEGRANEGNSGTTAVTPWRKKHWRGQITVAYP